MRKLWEFINTINRPCDEIYLKKIYDLYLKNGISKFACWHTVERLRQIPHIEIENKIPFEGRILDIGCGRGGFSAYISLKSSKREIYGIDSNPARIADALKINKNIQGLNFLNCGLSELTLKNEKYDVILIMDILHHNTYEEQKEIITQFNNLLKDDGKIVMLEPGDYPFYRHYWIWLSDYILYPASTTCKYQTLNEWKNLYESFGFKLVDSEHIINRGFFFTRKIMVFEKNG